MPATEGPKGLSPKVTNWDKANVPGVGSAFRRCPKPVLALEVGGHFRKDATSAPPGVRLPSRPPGWWDCPSESAGKACGLRPAAWQCRLRPEPTGLAPC